MNHQDQRHSLANIGKEFHANKWSLGTSSNYSMVVCRNPLQLLLTASGKDKGALKQSDFVVIDENVNVLEGAPGKPSAETGLHLLLAQLSGTGAVLHTHSVWGTVLSDLFAQSGGFFIEGYEMLKGLEGIKTHETKKWIDIFPNNQDIGALAKMVKTRLGDANNPTTHGFLIQNHGLYTWGATLFEARRHIEIFEFLFECVGLRRMMA